jgi:hypothetical protein
MAHKIGYVDDTGSEGYAHWQMLLAIKALAEANGWTTLRYLDPSGNDDVRELILKGVGLSGSEEIYIGFRAYQNANADWYNMSAACFTGYVADNDFDQQPGYIERGLCAHNQRIDYWLVANAQRVFFSLKIGAPAVYEVAYTGKYFPYATPGQYPYPVCCIGMWNSAQPTARYDSTSSNHTCGAKGNTSNGYLRDVMGTWDKFNNAPYATMAASRRDTGGYYQLQASVLYTSNNIWGELDSIRYLTGFNNVSENTVTIDGKTHVLIADAFRNGIGDYFALEMD